MKKLKIVFVLVLCFVSFGVAHADIFIIRPVDKRIEDIEKSREKLDKDFEKSHKLLQEELKSLSARLDANLKNEFYCVLPYETCTESTYQSIRGQAITNGLTPDPNQLAQCRAQIDEYNKKLKEYNQCFQDWQNKKIENSAQKEYEYQSRIYELKSELWCMDKEGNYSSFNKITKECECVEGSTFVNGKCVNRIDNLLMCVKTFGSLAHYDYKKAGCVCDEGSEFDFNNNNGFCSAKEKTNTIAPMSVAEWIKVGKPNTPEVPKKPLIEKKVITPLPELKATPKAKTTEEIAPKSKTLLETPIVQSQGNSTPLVNQKTTFWQRLKNNILKIKFW